MSETIWEALGSVTHSLTYRGIDGVQTRCLEAGDGRPLILLHGTGGHLEAYARNVGPLSERFRVIAFDAPGHGFSEAPAGYRYDWAGLASHVLAAITELDAERPILVGEGLGAQVAQWIAIHDAENVAGVILSCTLVVPTEDAELVVRTRDLDRFQELSRRALESPTEDLIRERMRWLMFDPASVTEELVSIRLAMWMRPEVREAQRILLASYRKPSHAGGLSVSRDDASRIETPLLLIWTEQNPLMPAQVAKRFSSYPAGPCEYVEFERSGLWAQYEEAERFNATVTAFVESLDASEVPAR